MFRVSAGWLQALSLACGGLPALPPLHSSLCVGILLCLCAQTSASHRHPSQNGLGPSLTTPWELTSPL